VEVGFVIFYSFFLPSTFLFSTPTFHHLPFYSYPWCSTFYRLLYCRNR